jgi:hypothetical protein
MYWDVSVVRWIKKLVGPHGHAQRARPAKAGRNVSVGRGAGRSEVSWPGSSIPEWDGVDEAGWESFPASDPPAMDSQPSRQL